MISFKRVLEEKEKYYAYCIGAEAFYRNKKVCPFQSETKEADEWWMGYLDAEYLRYV